jgi:hypothetical protein
MSLRCNLDKRLLRISPSDYFTCRDSFEHVHVMGGTGMGKTTGPGKALASAYLRAGYGFLVHTAKPEDIPLWIGYAANNGRANSVILLDQTRHLNFIDYEIRKQGMEGLGPVVEHVMQIVQDADQAMGAGAKESDGFWLQATRKCIAHCVPLLFSGWGTVSIRSIVDFVTQAPTDGKQYAEPGFAEHNFAAKTLHQAFEAPRIPIPSAERDRLAEYWVRQYPAIPSKTLGNIVISLSAKLDSFLHGRLAEMFCTTTDFVPEMAFAGGVLVSGMPTLTFNEDGVRAQKLLKSVFQRAALARNRLAPHLRERPVCLWADESQNVVTDKDHEFLSTSRASRVAVVYLTQSLPTYYAQLGPGKQDAAEALVGKFGTQIFCANGDAKTNKYASELIGRRIFRRANEGRSKGWNTSQGMNTGANSGYSSNESSGGSFGGGYQSSYSSGNNSSTGSAWGDNIGRGQNEGWNSGSSEQMDFILEPRFFAERLRTGGPMHNNRVTCVWVKAGARFADGDGGNFLMPTFRQR